jgi:hypothetical protein
VKALPERHHTVTKRQQNALFTRARRRGVLRTSAVGGSRSFVPRGFYEAHPHQPRLRWCLGPFRIWSPHGRVVKCREARRPTITPLPGPSGFFVPNRRPREDGPEYAWTAPRPSETMRALGGAGRTGRGRRPGLLHRPVPASLARHRFGPSSCGRSRGPRAAAPGPPPRPHPITRPLASESPVWARQRSPVWGMRPWPPRYYNRDRFKPGAPSTPSEGRRLGFPLGVAPVKLSARHLRIIAPKGITPPCWMHLWTGALSGGCRIGRRRS